MFRKTAVVMFAGAVGFLAGCGNQNARESAGRAVEVTPATAADAVTFEESKSDQYFDRPGTVTERLAGESESAPVQDPRFRQLGKAEKQMSRGAIAASSPGQPAPTPSQGVFTDGLHLESRLSENESLTRDASNESYEAVAENGFLAAMQNPLSTFSIDVDTASYSNMRRFLRGGSLPPADAVRIEELINYFSYDYPQPEGDEPFSVNVEIADCPWKPTHRLAKIGLQGCRMEMTERPSSNLVFLLDVSGSMSAQNKLPLVKKAMEMLVEQLDEHDRIAIVVYASASGLVLPSTPGNEREIILSAMDELSAGGSTNGGAGIQLAYNVARENFIDGGVNRVILCTDGDFNVGVTERGSLTDLITQEAKSGTFLSVLGFGMGNLKDATMEQLADKGNGNYAYIDSRQEARKVLVEEAAATLVTIAKDVKIQVDFNPAKVQSYRLIGYENRMLAAEDFKDDTKDAGEIGAGHSVTALYEIVPVGAEEVGTVEPSKYVGDEQVQEAVLSDAAHSGELLTVRLRYKQPDADTSTEFRVPVMDQPVAFAEATGDMQFAAAVAEFGMLLKGSKHSGSATLDEVIEIASSNAVDEHGYRAEFLKLAIEARNMTSNGEKIGMLRR